MFLYSLPVVFFPYKFTFWQNTILQNLEPNNMLPNRAGSVKKALREGHAWAETSVKHIFCSNIAVFNELPVSTITHQCI